MSIRYLFKNKYYLKSKRDFLSDYSRIESKRIDMTLSGKYLTKYGDFNFDVKKIDKYPFKEDIVLLEKILKDKLKIKNEVIIGNGANGLLQNIIKILFVNKGNLVTPFYTFNQAEFGVTSFNGYTRRVYCNEYKIDLDKIKKVINRKTRMVYICNPNNPTGIYIDYKKIIDFVKSIKIPVVIDESGIEFTSKKGLLNGSSLPDNLIILRSFSKAYGIANLRIGFLVCNSDFKELYMKKITTNEFSGISCNIAKDLFINTRIIDNVKAITKERKLLENELKKMNIEVIKSDSNILMTKTCFIDDFINILEDNDISIVPIYDEFNKFHFRIAVQEHKVNNMFIKRLKKILKKDYIIDNNRRR